MDIFIQCAENSFPDYQLHQHITLTFLHKQTLLYHEIYVCMHIYTYRQFLRQEFMLFKNEAKRFLTSQIKTHAHNYYWHPDHPETVCVWLWTNWHLISILSKHLKCFSLRVWSGPNIRNWGGNLRTNYGFWRPLVNFLNL